MRRIPATIVTGFLGAGKTSLVRHLLAAAAGHRLAVIVNEFGELGIDRELLLGCGDATCSDDDIVELANGCLCCTVADDFLPTLTRLIERAEPPDHIVVETSGLALPKPLVQAFAWPEIRTRMTVDGVVTVIDAAAVAAGPLRRRSRGGRAAARRRPGDRPRQPARGGVRRPARLRRSRDPEQDRSARPRRPRRAAGRDRGAAAAGGQAGRRRAGQGAAGGGARARCRRRGRSRGAAVAARGRRRARPRRFRQLCRRDRPGGRYRRRSAPGSPPRSGRTTCCGSRVSPTCPAATAASSIQAVGGRIEQHFDRPWPAGEARATRLVVIGKKGLDRAAVEAALARGDRGRLNAPARHRARVSSPTDRQRSISPRRRATSSCWRAPTPRSRCSRRRRRGGAPRTRRRRRLRLAPVMRLGHNFSVDLYMETVGAGAAGHRAAARRQRLLAVRRRAAGRDLPRQRRSRSRCCPATTSPTPNWPGSRPCRPLRAAGCGAIWRKAGRATPTISCAMPASLIGRGDRMGRAGAAAARRAVLAGARDAEPRRDRRRMAGRRRGRPDRVLPGAGAVRQHRAGRCAGAGAGRARAAAAAGLRAAASRRPRPPRCWRDMLAAHPPAVILNATGFSLAAAGGGDPLRADCPVLQIVFSGGDEGVWRDEHARPRSARSGDERRLARDRRPHPVARRVVQGAARPRPRDRGRSGRLSAGRRPGRLCRRSGAQLGAAARQAAGRAAGRDRARQLPEPRRPHRQRRRARHAGIGCRDPAGAARGRLPHRRHARGRRRADGSGCSPARPMPGPHAPAEETLSFAEYSAFFASLPPSVQQQVVGALGRGRARPVLPPGAARLRPLRDPRLPRRQHRGADPAGARLQPRPESDLSRPGAGAAARLSRRLCLAAPTVSAPTR